MRKVNSAEIYNEMTEKVVALMEEHGTDWVRPWTRTYSGTPINVVTGHVYQGINVIILAMTSAAKGWKRPYFASQKQWKKIGGTINEGECSTTVVYYSPNAKVFRVWDVYNADQVSGIEIHEPAKPAVINAEDRLAEVDAYIKATGAEIQYGYDHACYIPSVDVIQMPKFEAFEDAPSYYATHLHELVHWTGSANRLKRLKYARFGDDNYAFEELVAELGAVFLCAAHGITSEPRPDHAKYLNGWIKNLKEDPRAIFAASAQAQKAVNFLDDTVYGEEEEVA